ncbi:MAG TPA: hypothetical protein DCK83_13640 [Gallionellaceae bacterium]|nr:hypothetical protein [Gallionellaceae bacterium]
MAVISVLRKSEVEQRTGLSSSSIDRLEASGKFPARIKLSPNAVGWHSSEVDDWITSRPRGEFDAALAPVDQVQSLKRQIKAHEAVSPVITGKVVVGTGKDKAKDEEILRLENIADANVYKTVGKPKGGK